MAFGGEALDARPGMAFLFVDEISEHKGQHEGERRQFGVGAHLIEPDEFFVCEGAWVVRRCLGDAVAPISVDLRTGIEVGRVAAKIRVGSHAANMKQAGAIRYSFNRFWAQWRVCGGKYWRKGHPT